MNDNIIRLTLRLGLLFNAGAAYLVAFPSHALGTFVGVPTGAPPLYAFMLAGFILVFGLAYAWAASQPQVNRTIVAFGTIAKFTMAGIVGVLWLQDMAPTGPFLLVVADTGFPLIWALWLNQQQEN